ncbi:hypothetical protein CQW23_26881 [Capsicum baccatum]|uniref:Uncharacterized protein n=1 Tax=Capsicum baccatum TaxID=33114 RepID=A0A2G2VQ40_CAPBA|nr:hypothetical protein CQW23_26881 [Capsicum baccatum]
MALTILVLLTALFFMGFFSIYIRHFTNEPTAVVAGDDDDHRRRRNLPATSTTNVHRSGRKGMDSSTIESLPLISYGGAAKHLMEDCSICLTEFEVDEVCLDIVDVEDENGVSEESTVQECDTSGNVRSSCSSSNDSITIVDFLWWSREAPDRRLPDLFDRVRGENSFDSFHTVVTCSINNILTRG